MQVQKAENRRLYPDPREYPDYTEADAQACRALVRGQATPDQQKRAIEYIVDFVCATYDIPYRPGERDTLVALGKQIAGKHLVWLLQEAPVTTHPAERAANYTGDLENAAESE